MTSAPPPLPPETAKTHALLWRGALAVVVAAALVRLVVAAGMPLFPDETYYWDWSRSLATGYFDHPPMIAWLIAAGTALAGDTPLGVRLVPVIVGTAGIVLVCAAARRLADAGAALLAAVVFAVMPLSAAGLVLATPDAPLLAAIAGACYALVRVLEHPPGSRDSLRWWTVTGVALGLALTSKYTAALLPLGVVVAFALRTDLRARFREPGPYIAIVLALVVFLPVVLWNARNDWISFAFQLRHGLGGVSGSVLRRELDLFGGQLGLVSPVLFVLMGIAVYRALRGANDAHRAANGARASAAGRRALLAIAALVVFAFFVYSATRRRVEANWPAIAYVPAALLLVAQPSTARWRRWMRAGVGLAALVTVVTYVNAFVPILPVPARRDPVARAFGWDDAAASVARARSARADGRAWVGAARYQEASELAFHLPDRPRTFSINAGARVNQYDLWPAFPARAQRGDALILLVDDMAEPHPAVQLLAPHFERLEQDSLVVLARAGDMTKRLRIWSLEGWRGTWLTPTLRSRQ